MAGRGGFGFDKFIHIASASNPCDPRDKLCRGKLVLASSVNQDSTDDSPANHRFTDLLTSRSCHAILLISHRTELFALRSC
jgi:hypothetical protein